MELGGSDAYLVLEDANLEATDLATLGRLQNNGKRIAAKRFVVLDEIYDAFYRFTPKNESCKMGEPTDETSYYGPMARVDLRDELHEQVLKTVAQGGSLSLEDIFLIKMVLIIQPLSLLIYNGMEGFDNDYLVQ
jgi:succinate-semialdehyde dehydrogenase/glutarate-semialdehyde dehydrogenase